MKNESIKKGMHLIKKALLGLLSDFNCLRLQ